MIQDPFNPYGINRFPRIYRPRASSSAGILAGAGTQMVGPQPGGQLRGNGGGPPRGINRTTTGQGQPEAQQGLLGQALAGKEAYDQVNSAAKGGRNIRNYMSKPGGLMESGQDAFTGLGNMFSGSSAMTNAMGRDMVASPEMMNLLGGDTASRAGLLGGDVGGMSGMDTIMNPTFNFGGSATAGIDGAATAGGLSGLNGATTGGASMSSMVGPAMAGIGIGMDLIDGGEQGQKITGNSFGDAALRGGAAYFTGGLSEIFYAFL